MIQFDKLSTYRENNRLEAKAAQGGLPNSIWETYSSFANTDGGVILLGIEELSDGSFKVIGLNQPEKLEADFWNTINNKKKVNLNILSDKNFQIVETDGHKIIEITIPRASQSDKPIYINNDQWQAFRRNGSGDYRCTKESVQAMMRDASKETQDMKVLLTTPFSVFNLTTVKSYRNTMLRTRPGHVWQDIEDIDFLYKLGAVARGEDEKLHPTAGGLLMFGDDREIRKVFPNYFLDYQEHYGVLDRWSDRITSSSIDWSGNLYDFFFIAYDRLVKNSRIKIPFKIEGVYRVENTPIHKAIREAVVNCLVHSDYHCDGSILIQNLSDRMIFQNPGSLRLEIDEVISGGLSVPRNPLLMKLFNLIDIGERAGSGIPNIYRAWSQENWSEPQITERLDGLERIQLILPLQKMVTNTVDNELPKKISDKTQSLKLQSQRELILLIVKSSSEIRVSDIVEALRISKSRARDLLTKMVDDGLLLAQGNNRNRTYILSNITSSI